MGPGSGGLAKRGWAFFTRSTARGVLDGCELPPTAEPLHMELRKERVEGGTARRNFVARTPGLRCWLDQVEGPVMQNHPWEDQTCVCSSSAPGVRC